MTQFFLTNFKAFRGKKNILDSVKCRNLFEKPEFYANLDIIFKKGYLRLFLERVQTARTYFCYISFLKPYYITVYLYLKRGVRPFITLQYSIRLRHYK